MAVLLGLLVAASYGTGDFFGGFASRRSPNGAVVLGAQVCALAGGLLVALTFSIGDPVGARDVGFGVAAGAVNVFGIALLYRGLATGRMNVVAPLSAVTSAIVSVGWGLIRGERPSAVALSGVVLAVVAVAVISREPGEHRTGGFAAGVAIALIAGTALGASFVLYAETGSDSGMWPVVAARATAAPLVLLVLLARRQPLLPHPADRSIVGVTGLLEVAGTSFQLVAVRRELITLVAPVAALYPAATVLLARAVLHEPMGRERLAGLVLALVGLVLIAV
jgi:drug/metabolite transporter (DMT)-like permease